MLRIWGFLFLVLAGPAWAGVDLPAEVASRESGMGLHFTTKAGMTLYTFDRDERALESACVGPCTEVWPALAAPQDASPIGEWAPFTRRDGDRQWAFRGKPVYTFAQDKQPGFTLGDGVQSVWHIAVVMNPRPRAIVFQGTVAGRVAANAAGRTLYTLEKGACDKACLKNWRPLQAAWAAGTVGEWSVVRRKDDGTAQWAWRDRPLYTYAGDTLPGDLNGVSKDGNWRSLILQPTPSMLPWVTIQQSDYGPIFADRNGMTLYTIGDMEKVIREATCLEDCLKANWTPVLADATAQPTGNWSLIDVEGGRQWAYRGQPVYTFKRDYKPGSILGDRFALGGSQTGWRVILQATLREESL